MWLCQNPTAEEDLHLQMPLACFKNAQKDFFDPKGFFFPCILPSNQFLFDPNYFSLFSFSLAPR